MEAGSSGFAEYASVPVEGSLNLLSEVISFDADVGADCRFITRRQLSTR